MRSPASHKATQDLKQGGTTEIEARPCITIFIVVRGRVFNL